MKKSTLFVLGLLAFLAGFTQKAATSLADPLTLKELSYDFGSISQGRPVTHVFQLTNSGKSPLVIENVQASCGCTSPEWSSEPVAPGASSVITVGFNAASEGQFSKTITITYSGERRKTVTILGNVYHSPATSAPLNSSLALIKQINQ